MSNHRRNILNSPTSPRLRRTNSNEFGFSLVEMLIVAPIVILMIGIFVSAIVTMTGDVLSTRSANSLSYNIQDALDRIDADVKISGGFLAANNVTLSSPQGYDDGANVSPTPPTIFHNSNSTTGTMLILNSYATTSNPASSTQSMMRMSGQPNACGSAQIDQNPPVMFNIVYFVKNNTLWRRVLAPSNYTTVGCVGSSTGAPWQQPSCSPNILGTICKTQDQRLVDGIASGGFSINYFTSPSSTIANTIANDSSQSDNVRLAAMQTASTVSITINATSTAAGRNVSQSGTIRAISLNNNVSSTFITIKVLVVAGGGGGGAFGGGGGGGGVVYNYSFAVTAKTYDVYVGNGGNGDPTYNSGSKGSNGGNSIFDSITAFGGGGGGSRTCPSACNGVAGGSGGSGGGGSPSDSGAIGTAGIVSPSGQGNNGGIGAVYGWGGGGGGGAGGIGTTATAGAPSIGGNGGSGLSYSISGISVYYSGGGGGCAHDTGTPGSGGVGGGGAGAKATGTGSGASGAVNTGGGGGGGGAGAYVGGNGGSGIVIISYPTGSITATGGTITTSDGNTIHKFTGNGTFTIN